MADRTPGQRVTAPRGAVIKGPYRYTLWRTWSSSLNPVLCGWVMLNPSTADEHIDDPTIRRCCAYARQWGMDGIVVRNLFALRATSPRDLVDADNPIGPDNDIWLASCWDNVAQIIVAWGTGRWAHLAGGRWRQAVRLLEPQSLWCLRAGVGGQPVHPLYQPAHLQPVPWAAPLPGDFSAPNSSQEEQMRISIKIQRLHADDTPCTHRFSPSGKPREGENCPGAVAYRASCSCGCAWSYHDGIRAVVEEQRRVYLGNHPVTHVQ
jgi:hypothetical protein